MTYRARAIRLTAAGVVAALLFTTGVNEAARADASVSSDLAQAVKVQGADAPRANNAVSMPTRAGDPIALSTKAGRVTMSLPGADATQSTKTSRTFTNAHSSVTAQSLSDGFRALVHLDGPDAATEHDFTFGGVIASVKIIDGGGAVLLDGHSRVVGAVDAPWARDAAGANIQTRFVAHGRTLTQIVDHRGAAYPVVADPKVYPVPFKGVYIKFSKKETKWVAKHKSDVTATSAVCGLIPNAFAVAACGYLDHKQKAHINKVFHKAAYKNKKYKCVRMRFAPVLISTKAVTC